MDIQLVLPRQSQLPQTTTAQQPCAHRYSVPLLITSTSYRQPYQQRSVQWPLLLQHHSCPRAVLPTVFDKLELPRWAACNWLGVHMQLVGFAHTTTAKTLVVFHCSEVLLPTRQLQQPTEQQHCQHYHWSPSFLAHLCHYLALTYC